ncbi:hypothetical protein PVAP13_1NG269300 [Panicum virgatum]|uniref:Uncharacterized protein n=1 Tax=Panicum virgatum TaxID=38727 RepID=A0A8T0WSI3_PANVG|nr:hypothetical protein PVAP13_1NG269300 [Panicum virgatum]
MAHPPRHQVGSLVYSNLAWWLKVPGGHLRTLVHQQVLPHLLRMLRNLICKHATLLAKLTADPLYEVAV